MTIDSILIQRVWVEGKFRNSVSLGEETTYLLPRDNGVEFDLNDKVFMVPWGSVELVSYAADED